jgi:cell wall-associated NlpC family hydrolase
LKNSKNTIQPVLNFRFPVVGKLWLFVFLAGCMMELSGCRSHSGKGAGNKPRTGWLSRVFGRKKDRNESTSYKSKDIEKVIQAARSYRGTPHRDGGVSRLGIDCSALIMLSFKEAGLTVPRTARLQSELGRMIDKSELRPGDLVFFADRKIGSGITHVGLVTEVTGKGEIKFIHTSSRLGVTENLLSTSYFAKTYAKAVRPF